MKRRHGLTRHQTFHLRSIQPAVNPADIPAHGRVLSQLTFGTEQTGSGFPQFLTLGAEAYYRFNGYIPQTVGSSGRLGANNIFGVGSASEEDFPFIRELYASVPEDGTGRYLALLDSEAFTAAVSITVRPGYRTELDIDTFWYPRRVLQIENEPETGFAAYSSMFWKDEEYTHSHHLRRGSRHRHSGAWVRHDRRHLTRNDCDERNREPWQTW